MGRNDPTNLPLFTDDHRLNDPRRRGEQRLGNPFDVVAESEIPKQVVPKVQSVTDLVDGFFLGSIEESSVEGGWLEEEADFVAGIEKVFVARVSLIGIESAHHQHRGCVTHLVDLVSDEGSHWVAFEVEITNERFRLLEQFRRRRSGEEVTNDQVAVPVELQLLSSGKHALGGDEELKCIRRLLPYGGW